MRYSVASMDVLGNAETGWEVNDQHQIGSVDIADDVFDDDQKILDVLNAAGYLDNATIEDVGIDGDELYVEISDWETNRPLLALILDR